MSKSTLELLARAGRSLILSTVALLSGYVTAQNVLVNGNKKRHRDGLKGMLVWRNADYYAVKSRSVDVRWAQARLFVLFLMDTHRPQLQEFLRRGFVEAEGSSSSMFKRAFTGKVKRIEDFLQPWLQWLRAR